MAPHTVTAEQAGQTLAAVLRALRPGESWARVKALATGRRVAVGGSLCMDPARRLKEGEGVEVLDKAPRVIRGAGPGAVGTRPWDEEFVVVEKPPGVSPAPPPAEREGDEPRRKLV